MIDRGGTVLNKILTEKDLTDKSSQELTMMLYDKFLENLDKAIININNKKYISANKLLQKSNDILYRLGAGIKYDAGIIADQLDNLYNYMADMLIEANLNKDIEIIKEVKNIMQEISDGWKAAMDKGTDEGRVNKKVLAYEDGMFFDNEEEKKEFYK